MTYNELDEITRAFLTSDAKLLIIDSITAVIPTASANGDDEIETQQIGVEARIRSQYLKVYQGH